MLVYVRPSNEALLGARVPGAQDQRGCPSNPFYREGSASTETMPAASPPPSKLARDILQRVAWTSSNVRASNEALLRARVPRAQGLTRLPSLPSAPAGG